MSEWTDPKLDWDSDDVGDDDFIRIEGNTAVLHSGNGQSSLTPIAPDGDGVLDIGTTDQSFHVNLSTYGIKFITTAGRKPGNDIILIVTTSDSKAIYNYASSAPAGSAQIVINGYGLTPNSVVIVDHTKLRLTFDGTYWYCEPFYF